MTKRPKIKKNTIKNNRNDITGEFVTDEYVKNHPKTTSVEHNPKPKPKGK
jgi:hypothetical protein